MKRVIYLPDELNKNKYVLKETYLGHGIYRHMCPSGYYVHQEWAIVREKDNFTVMIQSYNNMCYEEILDAIDTYNEIGKYGLKALTTKKGLEHGYMTMHNAGKEI